jgi:hypothetical protein
VAWVVVRVNHEVCQFEKVTPGHRPYGPQEAPHWLALGEQPQRARFENEGAAREFAQTLQEAADTGSHPFRFSTFHVREVANGE